MLADVGLLILRLVVGLILAGHGAQKLFGWFGGPGLQGFAGWLGSMGLRPAPFWAVMAGLGELGSGVLLALGLLSPLGSLGIIAAMLMAIVTAHRGKGLWNANGGSELPLTNLTAELRDKYLRAAAAIENARKQAERVATARAIYRLQNLFVRLLEVADNLERALSYAAEADPLAPGVRATLRQLLDVLRREGVAPIEVEPRAPFDPRSHEAVETHAGDVPEMTVAAVRQPGYMFEGQVLRPARVVVTRPARADT